MARLVIKTSVDTVFQSVVGNAILDYRFSFGKMFMVYLVSNFTNNFDSYTISV